MAWEILQSVKKEQTPLLDYLFDEDVQLPPVKRHDWLNLIFPEFINHFVSLKKTKKAIGIVKSHKIFANKLFKFLNYYFYLVK